MAKTTKQTPDIKPRATKKKTPSKKKVTNKVEARKASPPTAPATKATAKQTVPTKKVTKKSVAKKTTQRRASAKSTKQITPQQRHDMVAQSAYFISESQGFLGDAAADWVAAEAEVDDRLAKAGIKVKG